MIYPFLALKIFSHATPPEAGRGSAARPRSGAWTGRRPVRACTAQGKPAAARWHAAGRRPVGAGHDRAGRTRHSDHSRRVARRRRPRHRCAPRPGAVLRDGSLAPARRRRARRARRPACGRRRSRGPAASLPRRGAARGRDNGAKSARGAGRVCRRREQRPEQPEQAAVRVPPASAGAQAMAARGQPARRPVDVHHAAGLHRIRTSPRWQR